MDVTLILLFVTFLLIHWFVISPYNHWKKRGIPGPDPTPVLGDIPNIWKKKENLIYDLKKIYDKFRGRYPMVGFFNARQPQLMVLEPELIKNILVKDQKVFGENWFAYTVDRKDTLFGPNLFLLHWNEWKERRTDLSPGFAVSKIKTSYPRFNTIAENYIRYVKEQNTSQLPFDARTLTTRYTCEMAANIVFSAEANSFKEKNPVFYHFSSNLFDPSGITRFMQRAVVLPEFWTKFFKTRFASPDTQNFFESITIDGLNQRMADGVQRGDYIDHLLSVMKKRKRKPVEMAGDAINFYIDNFETSSVFMTYVLYFIAKHPQVQEKLRTEIQQAEQELENGEWTYDAVENLQYLDQVVNESLRLGPVIVNLLKVAREDYKYTDKDGKDWLIEAGTVVNIPIYCVQRDPIVYDNPNEFNPDRFNPETGTSSKEYKQRCSLIPFGEGPRQCLGMRFSIAEVKRGVLELVNNFEITLNSKTPAELTLHPVSVVHLSAPTDIYFDLKQIM